jgi:uncharacterized protein (TIGR04255 family)
MQVASDDLVDQEAREGSAAVTEVATRREYPNPPIVEVICQVNFAKPVPWSAATAGLLYGRIRDEYPAEAKTQTAIEATLDGGDGHFQVGRGVQRFVYSNEEQNRRLVANDSCLSVNALPPYENWDSLRGDSRLHSTYIETRWLNSRQGQ